MKFNPLPKYEKAKECGVSAALADKTLDDNPYLRQPDIALSSWWQTGFLQQRGKHNE